MSNKFECDVCGNPIYFEHSIVYVGKIATCGKGKCKRKAKDFKHEEQLIFFACAPDQIEQKQFGIVAIKDVPDEVLEHPAISTLINTGSITHQDDITKVETVFFPYTKEFVDNELRKFSESK